MKIEYVSCGDENEEKIEQTCGVKVECDDVLREERTFFGKGVEIQCELGNEIFRRYWTPKVRFNNSSNSMSSTCDKDVDEEKFSNSSLYFETGSHQVFLVPPEKLKLLFQK